MDFKQQATTKPRNFVVIGQALGLARALPRTSMHVSSHQEQCSLPATAARASIAPAHLAHPQLPTASLIKKEGGDTRVLQTKPVVAMQSTDNDDNRSIKKPRLSNGTVTVDCHLPVAAEVPDRPPIKEERAHHQATTRHYNVRVADLLELKCEESYGATTGNPSIATLRQAVVWMLRYLHDRFDIGRDTEHRALLRYLQAEKCAQGLFVVGSSSSTTLPIIRTLIQRIVTDAPRLDALGTPSYDVFHFNCDFYSSCSDLYLSIRARLCGLSKLPPWRRVQEIVDHEEFLPSVHSASKIVVVLENVDGHVRSSKASKLGTLEQLLSFLNALVRFRRLKLIVIGHEGKTIRRFSSSFGGFDSAVFDKYILQIPRYTFTTLATHVEAILAEAVSSTSPPLSLEDVLAPKVVQLAAQKAQKYGQCELEPVVTVLRRAILKFQRDISDESLTFTVGEKLPRLRYEYVTTIAADYFHHDYVHRIRCVGVIPQTVLLVLIDSGPCTEEQLLARVWDRRRVHSWIMVIAMFRDDMFKPALELLLAVPVVYKREKAVLRDSRWVTETEYVPLPTREHLIQAAGDKERIRLII